MTRPTQASFVPHCDDGWCDLGSFQYTCIHCETTTHDYEIWWKQDDIRSGASQTFNCKKCDKPLVVEYDEEEFEFWVK